MCLLEKLLFPPSLLYKKSRVHQDDEREEYLVFREEDEEEGVGFHLLLPLVHALGMGLFKRLKKRNSDREKNHLDVLSLC